jgi:hypothetical protein
MNLDKTLRPSLFAIPLTLVFVVAVCGAPGCSSMASKTGQPAMDEVVEKPAVDQQAQPSNKALAHDALLLRLKAVAASADSQSEWQDLRLEWSDMQGLHGGTTFRVQGDGSTLFISKTGDRSVNKPGVVAAKDVQSLLADLLRLGVFSAKSPERQGVPDEVRLRVTAALDGKTIEVWRWQSDLTPGAADPIGQAKALFQEALKKASP